MAIATGSSTTSLLQTAGVSREEYGARILLDYPARSILLANNLVSLYDVAPGATQEAPVVGPRAVTSRTRGTDDGNAGTSSALDDQSVSFTKRSVYDQIQWDYMVNNDMRPEMVRAWLEGEGVQSAAAHANDFDATLAGLYSSVPAGNVVGGGGVHADISIIRTALAKLRSANVPKPYAFIFDESEWEYLDAIDELNRYDITGVSQAAMEAAPGMRPDFIYKNVPIYCTANIPAAGGITHNIAFGMGTFQVRMHDWIVVEEWKEEKEFSFFVRTWSDYRYALAQSDYLVDVQTAA